MQLRVIALYHPPQVFSIPSYNKASPATPTAPSAHDAAFTCDAAPVGDADGAAGAAEPLGLVAIDVPLGLPDMFS
jgi:hypothetical protein